MRTAPILAALLLVPAVARAQATIELPPIAAVSADGSLELASTHFNAIALGGTHAPADPVTLSATNGVLSLVSTSGLALAAGTGTGDATVTFTGSASDINAALDGLLFEPTASYAGVGAIDVTVGGSASITDSLRVAINAELDGEAARDDVLLGVTSVHGGVQPGRMVAFGPEAYSITHFPDGVDEGPMIAAASWGAGRVLAVPDHQMLNMLQYGADSGTFYVNGIGWLADSTALDVAIVTTSADVATWLGTQGGGLNLLTAASRAAGEFTFQHFTMRDGLPSNVIYGIQEDAQGYLWLSTNRGLAKFDPQSYRVLNYDSSHGLQGNEFSAGSSFSWWSQPLTSCSSQKSCQPFWIGSPRALGPTTPTSSSTDARRSRRRSGSGSRRVRSTPMPACIQAA